MSYDLHLRVLQSHPGPEYTALLLLLHFQIREGRLKSRFHPMEEVPLRVVHNKYNHPSQDTRRQPPEVVTPADSQSEEDIDRRRHFEGYRM